ncbi:MAG: DUF2752 domain-containing protein [Phycisphaerales bacterium]|nr:DUF2752 domain-containing protein [Planctomycetota bacterium]MCH8507283.1 DUF2752 domain-containing protein [Phycisphaerales bacterium]
MEYRKRQPGPVRTRDRWLAGLVLLGAAGVFGVLAVRHPVGLIPACPTAAHLGFYCPGCGSLRASHHLLNARPAEGWRHNPLLIVVGLPLGVWFAASLCAMAAFGKRLHAPIRGSVWAWAALAVILVYTAARNLPGEAFERLRPPEPAQSDPP